MDYQSLHMKTVADLRKLAKDMGVRIPAGTNKSVLIDMLLEAEKAAAAAPTQAAAAAPTQDAAAVPTQDAAVPEAAPRRRGRQPKKADEPAKAKTEEPAKAEAEEPKPEKKPVPAEKKPASAENKPAPVEKKASPVEKKPAPAEKKPAPAEKKPAPIENKPDNPPAQEKPAPPKVVNSRPMRPMSGEARSVNPAVRPAHMPGRSPGAPTGEPGQRAQNPRFVQRPPMGAPKPPQEAPRPQEYAESGSARGRREGYYNAEYKTSNPAVPEMLNSGDCSEGAGVLEIQQDGYGFLRAENCQQGPNDVYISIAQIRRFNLRMGDYVEGKTRPQREGDRYSAMLYITSVNGRPPEEAANRPRFEDLVPIYPDQRLRLETPAEHGPGDFSLRLVDMLAPIGKGQRGMIVSQPKAGKTTLLKKIANAITAHYPEIVLIVLLIDERPEEVTDMKRSIDGEVIYSTFDEAPENHVRVSEMVLERAQRLVEMGQDVVVLMDSITRLARAYNLTITPTGRSLSGGLDPGALFKPKRFFGAARNIENGGSLTVVATALVETGSRMDDIIFEEFKGTGNMELHLDRKLSDKRVFPAVDMLRSGTRREELLLTEAELEGEMLVRKVLSGGKGQEMTEQIIGLMGKTSTNAEFFEKLRGWLAVFEKEGYTLGGKL